MTQNIPLTLGSVSIKIPQESIAQTPLARRSDSRLLVRSFDASVVHDRFVNLGQHLPKNALLVLNASKVFPSRLQAKDIKGKTFEIFLLGLPTSIDGEKARAQALARGLAKLSVAQELYLGLDLSARILTIKDGSITLEFNLSSEQSIEKIFELGFTPLPPYIKREKGTCPEDRLRYQCVYAEKTGSVAAPTAGLHFDEELLLDLKAAGIETAYLNLHVGAGTFMPIKSDLISEHKMHREFFQIEKDQLGKILRAKAEGRPIVAVGTTSLRALESLYLMAKKEGKNLGDFSDKHLSTELFIYPKTKDDRYENYFADALTTNFHQSTSTLFFMICALIGFYAAEKLYQEAIDKGYRFFSYGDASLLFLKQPRQN